MHWGFPEASATCTYLETNLWALQTGTSVGKGHLQSPSGNAHMDQAANSHTEGCCLPPWRTEPKVIFKAVGINDSFSLEGAQSEGGQSKNHLRRSCTQGHKENRDQRAKRKIRTVVVIEAREKSF